MFAKRRVKREIKGNDVSHFHLGCRSFVMTFYPNRHLFLLYDFTDVQINLEPVQIKTPIGIKNFLLLHDKRIALFLNTGELSIWKVNKAGTMDCQSSVQVFQKKDYQLDLFESRNGNKIFTNSFDTIGIYDLTTNKFIKVIKLENRRAFLSQLGTLGSGCSCFIMDQDKKIFLIEVYNGSVWSTQPIHLYLFQILPSGEKKQLQTKVLPSIVLHNVSQWDGANSICVYDQGDPSFVVSIVNDALEIKEFESQAWFESSIYPRAKGECFARGYRMNTSIAPDVKDAVKEAYVTNSHHDYLEILNNNIVVNRSVDPKYLLNYQYCAETEELATNGIDFGPARTVKSSIKVFCVNSRVLDCEYDIPRLQEYMPVYMPKGVSKEILLYL